jgi:PD-(D/E)XK nuclease superfamily
MDIRFERRHSGEHTMSNHEDHEEHEGHEDETTRPDDRAFQSPMPSPWLRMRRPSPLPPETESVITETIGCAIAVHRALGPGFLERIYRRAMYIELSARHLAYEAEQPVKVVYRGVEIPGQRVDLIVEGSGRCRAEISRAHRSNPLRPGDLVHEDGWLESGPSDEFQSTNASTGATQVRPMKRREHRSSRPS